MQKLQPPRRFEHLLDDPHPLTLITRKKGSKSLEPSLLFREGERKERPEIDSRSISPGVSITPFTRPKHWTQLFPGKIPARSRLLSATTAPLPPAAASRSFCSFDGGRRKEERSRARVNPLATHISGPRGSLSLSPSSLNAPASLRRAEPSRGEFNIVLAAFVDGYVCVCVRSDLARTCRRVGMDVGHFWLDVLTLFAVCVGRRVNGSERDRAKQWQRGVRLNWASSGGVILFGWFSWIVKCLRSCRFEG